MTTTKRQQAHRFGLSAEKFACLYLRCKGYRVLAERYRNALGEIDIIARKGKVLVVVEVKARKNFIDCQESITPWKQQKIARAVEGLLAGQGNLAGLRDIQGYDIRFDAIWIAPKRWPKHIKDAWRL